MWSGRRTTTAGWEARVFFVATRGAPRVCRCQLPPSPPAPPPTLSSQRLSRRAVCSGALRARLTRTRRASTPFSARAPGHLGDQPVTSATSDKEALRLRLCARPAGLAGLALREQSRGTPGCANYRRRLAWSSPTPCPLALPRGASWRKFPRTHQLARLVRPVRPLSSELSDQGHSLLV